MMAFLLDQVLDVNARDVGGKTPLHEAIGNSKVVELLLAHKADVHAVTADGQTPLHLAARGYAEAARLLLDHGADVNACRKTDGRTPLDIAKKANHPALIQLFTLRGGKSAK